MAKNPRYWSEKSETLSPEEYREVQNKAFLREFKYICDNSLFYKEKYGALGLETGDIKKLDDLKKLPFTTKLELRNSLQACPPLGKHIATSIDKVVRIYSTSGTSGTPTYIGLTRHDLDVWRECCTRGLWATGMRPHHIIPEVVGTFFVGAAYGDAIENLGAAHVPIGIGATDRLITAIQKLGANFMNVTTSFALYFIDACQQRGVNTRSLNIKGFMVGGEPGGGIPHIRNRIEEAFGASVQEVMGNGDMIACIWAECEQKKGMHFIAQGMCYPEIIDPDTHEVMEVREGIEGELVYTSLNRECQPLIRFRTGDHVIVTQTSCECGRTGYGIRCIGRMDDMLIVSGVNIYPLAVKEIVSSFIPRVTGEILIQLDEPPPSVKPPMKIKVELGEYPGE